MSEREAIEDIFESQYAYAATKHGHTEARARSTGFELRLDLGVGPEHLMNVIHDLSYRKAIIDVNKILRFCKVEDGVRIAPVESAIISALSEETYNQFQPWLQHIARDETRPTNAFEASLRGLRRRTQVVVLGVKAAVSLSQVLGWAPAAKEVGHAALAKNILYFYQNPLAIAEKANAVFEKSEAMRARASSRDRDLRSVVMGLRKEGKYKTLQEAYFYAINLFDAGVTIPIWLTAYEKAIKKWNWDEAKAIEYADQVVRMTQDIGTPKDLSAVQRGGDAWKLFNMFYNAMNTQANMLINELSLASRGLSSPGQIIGTAFNVVALPALAGALLSGQGPEDEDDPDKGFFDVLADNPFGVAKWAAGNVLSYPFSFVPLLRDATGIFNGYSYRGPAGLTPLAETAKFLARLNKEWDRYAEEGEIDWRKLGMSSLMMSGYVFGLPAGQATITINAILDWLEGEKEVKPQDLFLYRKRK